MEIHSYRAVFDLERRIYRIDRLRLNPSGVPLRGIVYCLALAIAFAILGELPLLGAGLRLIPWYLRELALPAAAAALLTVLRIEGRPFHLAALALLAHASAPRSTDGAGAPLMHARWRPQPLLLLPDGSDGAMRRFCYRGPGSLTVNVAHRREEWGGGLLALASRGAQLRLRPLPERPRLASSQRIELAPGARLRVG